MKTFCLALLAILVFATVTTPSRSDTVALWLFDDPPDSSAAIDASGHGYHLTLGPDAAIVPDGFSRRMGSLDDGYGR